MSSSPFELNVDADWKKQAQEEKRRLAEEAKKRQEASEPKPAPAASPAANRPARPTASDDEGPADFRSLVRSVADQAMVYLGAVPINDGRGIVDLDAAKRQVDLLGVLEAKTTGNLDATEQAQLDLALYESRTRFASVASRYIL